MTCLRKEEILTNYFFLDVDTSHFISFLFYPFHTSISLMNAWDWCGAVYEISLISFNLLNEWKSLKISIYHIEECFTLFINFTPILLILPIRKKRWSASNPHFISSYWLCLRHNELDEMIVRTVGGIRDQPDSAIISYNQLYW